MKLLQATIDLVASKGEDAVEMKEVASIARVSRAMAYRYFEDRDHLLREAKRWVSDRLLESVEAPQSPAMEDQVVQVARLVLGNLEASRLWVAEVLAGKTLDPGHPLHQSVVRTLEEFRSSGRARQDIDIDVLTSIMLGTVPTLIMLGRRHEGADIEVLARRFTVEWTHILNHGLFARSAKKKAEPPDAGPASPALVKTSSRARSKPRNRS
jgi:AcrR family transcriptional regulator